MAKLDLRPPCWLCQHCEQLGRQQTQKGRLGRKRYYCKHPRTREMTDKHGLPLLPFIGYGDMTVSSPLVLKTHKKWCPLREVGHGKA